MEKIHPSVLAGVAGCPSPQEQDFGATVDIQTSANKEWHAYTANHTEPPMYCKNAKYKSVYVQPS